MREIRLPRAVLALLIGAGLGLSGAALQGYLRNPLAEPGLLGVSGAAALGAVVALYTGLAAAFPLALPLMALAGAFAATLLVQALAGAGVILDHADPRRPRGLELRLRPDRAGAQPRAEPLRRLRDRALAARLAGRPLAAAPRARRALHPRRLRAAAHASAARSTR